jgi:predicted ABC-type ATPase
MPRPVLYVLAGVNGAGKSSIGGHLLTRHGLSWFDPDAFARDLVALSRVPQAAANELAWAEGLRRLDAAIGAKATYAFETTLGGRTMVRRIATASRTNDVLLWFCGLDSPERHIARVRARVAAGGHDIPPERIRQRYPNALANLIALMPRLTHLQVYDNSTQARRGAPVPDPMLVLEMEHGRPTWPRPHDLEALTDTPTWAKPLVEAAHQWSRRR